MQAHPHHVPPLAQHIKYTKFLRKYIYYSTASAGGFLAANYYITGNAVYGMQIGTTCGSGWQPVALETVEEEEFVLGMFTESASN